MNFRRRNRFLLKERKGVRGENIKRRNDRTGVALSLMLPAAIASKKPPFGGPGG